MSISKRLLAIRYGGPHPLASWKTLAEWDAAIEAAAERLPVGAVLGLIGGEPATVAHGGWVKLGDRGYCPPTSSCLDPFRDRRTWELVLPEPEEQSNGAPLRDGPDGGRLSGAGPDRAETGCHGLSDGSGGRGLPAPLEVARAASRRRPRQAAGQLAFAFGEE
jgi:hypothetical protein